MKRKSFVSLIIILILIVLGVVGYSAYKNNLERRQNVALDGIDQLKTYKNDSTGVEFQYDKGSEVVYEVKDGDIFINGVNRGPDRGSFVRVVLNDQTLAVNVGGKEMLDDIQYFTLEAMSNDGVDRGGVLNNCDEGASKETRTIVNKHDIKFWLTDYTGQFEQRVACFKRGDYIWTFTTQFVHPVNKNKISRLFDLIINSFHFSK